MASIHVSQHKLTKVAIIDIKEDEYGESSIKAAMKQAFSMLDAHKTIRLTDVT